MDIAYSKGFIKSAKLAPKPIQNKLADSLEVLKRDHFHSTLHTKPLAGDLKGFYSFRITRDWRVIFSFMENPRMIFLIDVALRKDIYR